MKSLSGIMSQKSQNQYLANCRARYPSRNRVGKSAMIDKVRDTLGWGLNTASPEKSEILGGRLHLIPPFSPMK
jgi:hypothetical protein